MTFALSGLAIVTLAWLIQLIRTWNGKGLSSTFVLLYGVGVALLVIDGTQRVGLSQETWLYLVTLLIVGLMYLKLHK